MRFMMIVKANPETEAGVLPEREAFEEMGRFNEEMIKAGVMLAAEGLHSTAKGARVRFEGAKRTVIDGPFTESKELVAGFWLIQATSLDEALEWAKRSPFQEGELEVRQVFEMAEFADIIPPEEIERKERARAEVQRRAAGA